MLDRGLPDWRISLSSLGVPESTRRESQLGQDFSTGERRPGQLGLDRVGAQTVRRSAAARSDATIDAQTGIYAVETESDPRRENDAAA
jgi:hypothetical protein